MRYLFYTLAILAAGLIILALVSLFSDSWFYHPLGQCAPASSNHTVATHEIIRCKSYNFHSGIGANFGYLALVLSFLGIVVNGFRQNNCSVNSPHFCWRFGHPVVGTSFKACHKHHPGKWRKDDGKVSPEHIHCAYKEVPTVSPPTEPKERH